MIRGKVQQLNRFADLLSELHHTVEELGVHSATLRTVVDFELDLGGSGLCERVQTFPSGVERLAPAVGRLRP